MKQYTDEQQTTKLMELGFEKPKSVISYSYPVQSEEQQAYEASLGLDPYLATVDQIEFEYAYSIGELIEMLPKEFDGELLEIAAVTLSRYKWVVRYPYGIIVYKNELIDALYDMVVNLKEEGVI